MTKQEIKTELENVIYVLETLENDYAALKLKAVLLALENEWNQSDYYAQQINNDLDIWDEIIKNLK
jgi:hypothetical protein